MQTTSKVGMVRTLPGISIVAILQTVQTLQIVGPSEGANNSVVLPIKVSKITCAVQRVWMTKVCWVVSTGQPMLSRISASWLGLFSAL